MSKSVGNIISLTEGIDRYGPGTIRLFFLRAHYRSPIDFSEARLAEAQAAVERLQAFVRSTEHLADTSESAAAVTDEARAQFRDAMDDDLATPRALAGIFDLVAAGNGHLEAGRSDAAAAARAAGPGIGAGMGPTCTSSMSWRRSLRGGRTASEMIAMTTSNCAITTAR